MGLDKNFTFVLNIVNRLEMLPILQQNTEFKRAKKVFVS